MKPLRNGDLTDAAELIDSAQGCAKLMAECCAAKDAEIARLREAIRRLVTAADLLEENATDPADWAEYHAAVDGLREIAREEEK